MSNLWSSNTPEKLWLIDPSISAHYWQEAADKSKHLLGLDDNIENIDELLASTLGEGRFGLDHWRLSLPKRFYYLIKPLLPRFFTKVLRRYYTNPLDQKIWDNWPIDSRYILFQWETIRQLLIATSRQSVNYKNFWPENHQFAFVLTHDIETAAGQEFVREVANLEESFGFRSSFNFVLERYRLDFKLIEELRERGFEIGCHGLKHDGKLYNSKTEFTKRAKIINARIKEFGMVGFRSPLTHRNPDWMQILDIEYDSSFFDTDPFEPIPGGAMSIWPYFLGNFVELPYTLVQDYTLVSVLGESTPRIWLEKTEFIKEYYGMALLNTHPDYLMNNNTLRIYSSFLQSMKNSNGYWHAIPRDVARWWKARVMPSEIDTRYVSMKTATLKDKKDLVIT
jgi:peptidoglycan/xylan/chitin deacetylase (PgdA/CDA1 family)